MWITLSLLLESVQCMGLVAGGVQLPSAASMLTCLPLSRHIVAQLPGSCSDLE